MANAERRAVEICMGYILVALRPKSSFKVDTFSDIQTAKRGYDNPMHINLEPPCLRYLKPILHYAFSLVFGGYISNQNVKRFTYIPPCMGCCSAVLFKSYVILCSKPYAFGGKESYGHQYRIQIGQRFLMQCSLKRIA